MQTSSVAAQVAGFDTEEDRAARKSQELTLQLLEHSTRPFSRDQFEPGHITATGLVLHPERSAILIVHHRRLDRWLLPGGHVEEWDDEIWQTAAREAVEETSVQLDLTSGSRLIGLDVHGIPPKRKEPFHLHHDLIFTFRASSDTFHGSEEARAVAWCASEEFGRYQIPDSVRRCFLRASNSTASRS